MENDYICALSDRWYEKCWLKYMPPFIVNLGHAVALVFDPLHILFMVQFTILILHFTNFEKNDELLKIFKTMHQISTIPMVGIVGLYLLFKQSRPCICSSTGKRVGSEYGMPSGDSLFSAVIGCFIFKANPFVGIFFPFLVGLSRIVRGYHTILQVCIGFLIGITNYFIFIFTEEKFVFYSWFFSGLFPFLVLFDSDLIGQTPYDIYNLSAWLIGDLGTLFFDIFVCSPKKYNILNYIGLKDKEKLLIGLIFVFGFMIAEYFIISKGISLQIVKP